MRRKKLEIAIKENRKRLDREMNEFKYREIIKEKHRKCLKFT